MSNIDKNLQHIFDTMDAAASKPSTAVAPIRQEGEPVSPYDDVIDNLRQLIQRAHSAMESSQSAAESNEEPRSYEAYAIVAKNLIEMNRELKEAITAREKWLVGQKTGTDPDAPVAGSKVTNNILAIGTTSELQDLLSNMLKRPSTPADVIDVEAKPLKNGD